MRKAHLLLLAAALVLPVTLPAATSTVLGWNNLGMHCMDSDYSVFSILPPYNTIEAQLIVGGRLVTNGSGYTVTYQAVADPAGSFNSTAMGKGNFYTYATALYGATLAPEAGLAGWSMPGLSNTPQGMVFESTNYPAPGVATPVNWFLALGIPISPYDDAHAKNAYPLMRVIVRNTLSQPIATNDIVLPVSDEMDCRACHASGTQAPNNPAQPAAGWVWVSNPERDYRLNILRLHDEHQFSFYPGLYAAALAARGFNPQGLYRGVVADDKPVLCAACHSSEALGTASYSNIPPLTASVHALHAYVQDPVLNLTLDSSANRAACYRCHPGSTTRCLRGAMGSAVAADGSMEMQCQSCHGNMSAVGSPNRVGWFMEPNCQSCHTGTATHNNGQIRYTSALEAGGTPRVAVDQTFATKPNTPATGLSLYRFSAGHGGLQCSACHGSTHAEFPSSHVNDNLRNLELPFMNHVGVVSECTACHTATPNTPNGGPHGLHAIGQGWVSGSGGVTKHADVIESLGGSAACAPCHGTDFRGTVLSRAKGDRTLAVSLDGGSFTLQLFRGAEIGCYNCHSGPNDENLNSSTPPSAANVVASTASGQAVGITLAGSGGTARVISQPAHGSVAWTNRAAVYHPEPGFVGTDTFTFAAWDGLKNSVLATGTVTVAQGPFSISAQPQVPSSAPAGWPASFGVVATPSNVQAAVQYLWTFGDSSPPLAGQYVGHAYTNAGSYHWTVVSSVQAGSVLASVTNSGDILISGPERVNIASSASQFIFSWPAYQGDALLEWSPVVGPAPVWTVETAPVNYATDPIQVVVPNPGVIRFYRLKKL
jgi:hypothetical protein